MLFLIVTVAIIVFWLFFLCDKTFRFKDISVLDLPILLIIVIASFAISLLLFKGIFPNYFLPRHHFEKSFEITRPLVSFRNDEFISENDDEIIIRIEKENGDGFERKVVPSDIVEFQYGDSARVYIKGKKCIGYTTLEQWMYFADSHEGCDAEIYDEIIITVPKQ